MAGVSGDAFAVHRATRSVIVACRGCDAPIMDPESYCWRAALKSALRRNRRDAHNRYLQLATVRADGTPAVRTLVFRGFDADPARLHMVTDARSAKVDEIRCAAPGELCWYFTHTREQFRLQGTLSLAGPGADADARSLRADLWRALSDKARGPFYGPPPGEAMDGGADPGGATYAGGAVGDGPPATFLGLTLNVMFVDHLRLRGDPQLRWQSRRDVGAGWWSRCVTP